MKGLGGVFFEWIACKLGLHDFYPEYSEWSTRHCTRCPFSEQYSFERGEWKRLS